MCNAERPPPAEPAGFYDTEHGYPVSVIFPGRTLSEITLRLELAESGEAVPGVCFTPQRPIHASRPRNGDSAFFVAERPLLPETRYRAAFEAVEGKDHLVREWVFKTGP